MKYISFFILALTSWNSWGKEEFTCPGGQAYYEELKWDVQNYQEYDQEYQAGVHNMLFYCQMAYGANPEDALQNLKMSVDLGDISSNFRLAEFYLTGGWGRHEAVKSRDWAILEFENTLKRINAVFADYPDTVVRAEGEIVNKIYPRTLLLLIENYTNKYFDEGYEYYNGRSPTHYGDPTEAIERDQAHRDILNRLEYHVESCLADHEGQHMMERAKRWSQYEEISSNLAAYSAFYLKVKTEYCPLFKELLEEIRAREATMHAIALNCTPPSEQATEERPPCTDIKIETEEFAKFFTEEWLPKQTEIISS